MVHCTLYPLSKIKADSFIQFYKFHSQTNSMHYNTHRLKHINNNYRKILTENDITGICRVFRMNWRDLMQDNKGELIVLRKCDGKVW